MSYFSDLDLQLQEISKAMAEEPLSTQVEYRADCIIRELRDLPIKDRIKTLVFCLDELCALAKEDPNFFDRYMAGQIITRAQLVGSFLLERNPGHLKVIRNA